MHLCANCFHFVARSGELCVFSFNQHNYGIALFGIGHFLQRHFGPGHQMLRAFFKQLADCISIPDDIRV